LADGIAKPGALKDGPRLQPGGYAAMRRTRTALLAVLLAVGMRPALAADDVTIGKAVATSFAFVPVDVGLNAGIWQSEGLNVTAMAFRGDAVLQTALTAGSVDFGLGSGPALGFHVKGAPVVGVAVVAGAPYNMALCVPNDGTVKTPEDLKGKRIGFTTVGSLTDWLTRELSRQEGWGPDGIRGLALGPDSASVAAIRAGQADGFVGELADCLQLQQDNKYHVLLDFGDRVKDFYTHIMFAREDLVQNKPDVVRRVLQGWFKTIAYMKAHKQEAIQPALKILGITPQVASEMYDREMAMMSDDGAFDPKTLEVVAKSLKELGILPEVPPISKLYDGQFVPVKLQ
jgi:NitT/TauT family transport system substrate-binding protein